MKMILGRILCLITDFFHGKASACGPEGEGTVVLERTLHAPDGKHRVCFFRRTEDGVCGFREEYYDDKTAEHHWTPMGSGDMQEYGNMDEALAAAKAEVLWVHLVTD